MEKMKIGVRIGLSGGRYEFLWRANDYENYVHRVDENWTENHGYDYRVLVGLLTGKNEDDITATQAFRFLKENTGEIIDVDEDAWLAAVEETRQDEE